MGNSESISHGRRIETLRLINLLQEELIPDMEQRRKDEWQMEVRKLYNFVEEDHPDLSKPLRRQKIGEQISALRELWSKELKLDPAALRIREELFYESSGLRLRLVLGAQSLADELVKTIFAYYHRVRGYSIDSVNSIRNWFSSYWRELLVCVSSTAAFIVSEQFLFPGKFKNGFTFTKGRRKVHVSPYLVKVGAFGAFSLLF